MYVAAIQTMECVSEFYKEHNVLASGHKSHGVTTFKTKCFHGMRIIIDLFRSLVLV